MGDKDQYRIGFAGAHMLDLVLYCSYILKNMGLQVLVCDWTRKKVLYDRIQKPKKEMHLIRYKGMDFAFSQLAALDENYDVLLYVQDFAEPLEVPVHRQIFVCDGLYDNTVQFVQMAQKCFARHLYEDGQVMVVYRDIFEQSGCGYIKKHMKQIYSDASYELLMHDCMDEAAYQYLQFHVFSSIGNISEEMEACLKSILIFMDYNHHWEERQIKKAVRLSKRGKGS